MMGNKFREGYTFSDEEKHLKSIGSQGKKSNHNTTSQYVGVFWNKGHKKWQTNIHYKGRKVYIGRFKYEIEAALAYNEYALEYYGANAKINSISQEEIDLLWELE